MIEAMSSAAKTASTENDRTAVLDDLHQWLPTVLDDAVMRDAVERAVQREGISATPIGIAAYIFTAITGRPAPVRLTSAIALTYVGAGLCDDVADGDIEGGALAESQATLVAGLILASLAPQAIASLLPPSDVLSGLRCLWRGLQVMSSGQRRDLALFGASYPDPREVEAALAKSTAECGMYAALAARAAGVTAEAPLACWENFGAALGYALEVNSDCQDVLHPAGRDIATGARTLPIALALQDGAHLDSARLRNDLAAARDPAACARARDGIVSSGSLIACGALVEAAIIRAERILDTLAPPHGTMLRAYVSEASFLRRR